MEHTLCTTNLKEHGNTRSGHWYILDYTIVRKRDTWEVQIKKVRIDVECWTDHRILITKFYIALNCKPKGAAKSDSAQKFKDTSLSN